jgi:hypothetical protein
VTDADAKQIALLQADDRVAGDGGWQYVVVGSEEEVVESRLFNHVATYGAHMHGRIHPDEIGAVGATRYILRKS